MSSTPSTPPPPNYGPLAQASERQATLAFKTSQEQLDWAKEQYANQLPFLKRVQPALASLLEQQMEAGAKDRARYEQLYQPLEDMAIDEARQYTAPERMAMMRGRAVSGVNQQFAAAGDAARRNLESFGVNPSSTRMAALDLGVKMQQAASAAGAGTMSDTMQETIGRQLRDQAINTGKGYPAQSLAAQQGANQSGMNTVGAGNQTFGAFSPALGNSVGWSGQGFTGLNTAGNLMNMGFQNQMQGAQFGASQSSGAGAIAGSLLGAGTSAAMMFSDERMKENMVPVGVTPDGQTVYDFNYKGDPTKHTGLIAQEVEQVHPEAVATDPASGMKMVDYEQALPMGASGGMMPPKYASPGAIPKMASPSGGREHDVTAQLEEGEFVLPKWYVQRVGEKKIQKEIAKEDELRRQPQPAEPGSTRALPGPPTYASSGARSYAPIRQVT